MALITLNPVEAVEFLRAHMIGDVSDNLARSESMRKLLQEMIDEVNGRLSTSESIKNPQFSSTILKLKKRR